jgi:hypothetical protein
MQLLDLKTDLKSLKYGKDRPGGGDSGQPYQKVDINRIDSGFNRFRMTNFDDGLVRGGIVGAANASVVDTLRIGKFLTDLPKGPLWIVKQVGLQLSNPKLESRKSSTGIGFIDTIANKIDSKFGIGPTRTYNLGINTIAQIPVNAFGVHFNRHGLLPVQDDNTKYLSVVTANNKEDNSKNNRLVGYVNTLLNKPFKPVKPASGLLQSLLSIIPGGSNFITPQQQTIDSYVGGPNSIYGIGRTFIRRYDYTTVHNKQNNQTPQAISKVGGNPGNVQYLGDLGVSKDYFISGYTGDGAEVKNNITNNGFTIPNYSAITYTSNTAVGKYIELQNKLTKQSNLTQSYYNGNVTGSYTSSISTVDSKVNRTATDYKYYGGRKSVDGFSGSKAEYGNTNVHNRGTDANILSVVFRAIDPFTKLTLDENRFLFSAYMNGFKDNFDATWGDINYTGRAESFYIYNKFKRNVSFNLQIPCFNKVELFIKHRALGQLASTTAGAYSDNNLLGGILLKVNVGNYLVGEYAVLNSLSYDIPNDTAWDISEDALLAMNINASFNLTIVHKKLPQYSATEGFFGYLPKPPIPNNINQDKKDAGFFISSDKVKLFTKD